MKESVTGFETEDDWESALAEAEDLDDLDEALDEGEDAEDELTDEEGSPPAESEGADPTAEPEADAEAEQEADADGEEQQEEPEEPDPEAGEPEEPEAEGEPAPESPAGDQDQAPEQPEQPQHNGELTLRADGTDIHLEGSMSWDHGVYIPMETLRTKLQPMLADRRKLQSEIDRLKAHTSRKSEAEVQAEELVKAFDELLKDKEKAFEFIENFDAQAPALAARAEAARHKARADGYEQEREADQQRVATERFQEWAPRAVDDLVGAVLDQPEFKELGLDRKTVFQQVRQLGSAALFYRAAEDDPAHGIRKGDIRIRPEPILRHVQHLAQVAQQQRAAAAAVREAKTANDRKSKPKRKAPPAVSASGTPVPGDQEEKEPESYDEWEASLR